MVALISPSILSADFANLESELASISNADMVHVDVMDGHFVPNLTIGLPVVERLAEVSNLPLDVHLMIDNPDELAQSYARLGAASVTFHFEAAVDVSETIRTIRESNSKVGLAIKPKTRVAEVEKFLSELDMILVMTVEPGFGGQALIEETVPKISQVRDLAKEMNPNLLIQVDGGVTDGNISRLARSGANVFVAGTSIFISPNRNEKIDELRVLAGN